MKNLISTSDQVKPNFKKVKDRWKNLLSRYYVSDGSLNEKYLINVDCPHCESKRIDRFFSIKWFLAT